jgi:hypothetical protein
MRAHPLVAAIALGSTLLYAEDFSLTKDGFGPITVHTTVTYEGKGERMAATAVNDSGQLIPYVKLCLVADTKGVPLRNVEHGTVGAGQEAGLECDRLPARAESFP